MPIPELRVFRSVSASAFAAILTIWGPAALAEDIIVDTTSGTINGIEPGGKFNGVSFYTSYSKDTTTFTFEGDFIVNDDDRVIGIGPHAVSFKALNNAVIGDRVQFLFSALGTAPGPGGGAGGTGTNSTRGGQGGRGGIGGAGGNGAGSGGQTDCSSFFRCILEDGEAGRSGSAGESGGLGRNGDRGAQGGVGGTGVNGGIGGAGGAGGLAGMGGGLRASGGLGGNGGAFGAKDQRIFSSQGKPGDGGNAGNGSDGGSGFRGTGGISGAAGAAGTNNGASTALTGGGGGGAGGAGGGGGGGAGGSGGGGGGEGGGGASSHGGFLEEYPGGRGGNGGRGGRGGFGGNGGTGGRGGAGGGGGGAFEISAAGRVIIGPSSALDVRGGTGADGRPGSGSTEFFAGPEGRSGSNRGPNQAGARNAGNGGLGGTGGTGGRGRDGGTGGTGGSGAGGSGGTVKIVGSVVEAGGVFALAQGGLAESGGNSGGNGRVVLASNTEENENAPIFVRGTRVDTTGSTGSNPYSKSGLLTPFIPDLLGGAELFGLLDGIDARDSFFDFLNIQAPNRAFAAGLQLDLGPTGYADDFTGYDLFLFVNLTADAISDPLFGFGEDFTTPLSVGGWTRDPANGGSGDEVLSMLDGYAVWAVLGPEADNIMNFSGSGASQRFLSDGGTTSFAYLVTSVPIPASTLLLLNGIVGLIVMRKLKKRKASSNRQ